ncbi:hypothetical protein GCM10017778_23160 [Streptomyces vinaceus]|nr:hypothetical protein GCM10017778_23160 [Streptomyces vinaceus]
MAENERSGRGADQGFRGGMGGTRDGAEPVRQPSARSRGRDPIRTAPDAAPRRSRRAESGVTRPSRAYARWSARRTPRCEVTGHGAPYAATPRRRARRPAQVWYFVGDLGAYPVRRPHLLPSAVENGAHPETPGAVRAFTYEGRGSGVRRISARAG